MPRDRQLDFFIATASDALPIKSAQDLMARAWFSLSKDKRTSPLEHRIKNNFVKITPHPDQGMATIWDYDVVLFIISHWMDEMNQGRKPPRGIVFTPYEYFRWRGIKANGRNYERLRASLERLHTTQVETNIRQGRKATHHHFYWVQAWTEEIENDQVRGLLVEPPAWLHEAVVKHKKLTLTLDDDYFEITSGIERWLYLYVRKAAGTNVGWKEKFRLIHEKSGSTGSFKKFTHTLRNIIEKQALPHYRLEEVEGMDGESYLSMMRRAHLHHSHPDHEIEYPRRHKGSYPKAS